MVGYVKVKEIYVQGITGDTYREVILNLWELTKLVKNVVGHFLWHLNTLTRMKHQKMDFKATVGLEVLSEEAGNSR